LHYENDKVDLRTICVCKQLNYKGEADFKGGQTYLEDSSPLFSILLFNGVKPRYKGEADFSVL